MEKILDFGCVPVGIRTKEMNIHVKNKNRTPAVFHLKCDSDELQISPMVCKVPPDSKQTISISFLSNVEKNFNSKIEMLVRGGKPEEIPVKASSVIPQIRIEEEIFDFGSVT